MRTWPTMLACLAGVVLPGVARAASNQAATATCATAADCRTTLGLGTAATLNTGTGAGQVVVLDGSAALPAVSGAALTNVPAASYSPASSTVWAGTDPATSNAAADRLAALVGNVPNSLSVPSVTGTVVYFFLPNGIGYELVTSWPDANGGGITATSSVGLERYESRGQVSHVRFAANTSINLGSSMGRPANWTASALFQLDDLSGLEAVFASAPSSGASVNSAGFMIADGGGVYYTFGNGTNYSDGTTAYTLTARKWHVVTVRYTAGDTDCDVWVDGTVRAPTPATTAASASTGGTAYQWHVGAMGERTAAWRMNGRVAAAILYSTALTDGDVGTLNTWMKGLGGVQ